jgi:hypothetical protein
MHLQFCGWMDGVFPLILVVFLEEFFYDVLLVGFMDG